MCKPVHHEVDFEASPRQVYNAYLDSEQHSQFTGQRAKMSRKEGARFTAGDAYITGYNLELIGARRIVQAWRASEWPEGSYSVLRMELVPKGKGTHLVVDHVGIPNEFRDGVDSGWYEFYWEPMKKFFGEEGTPSRRPKRARRR